MLFVMISVQAQKKIIVDAGGKGDFKTIQEAINSLTANDEKPRTIYIKNGIYKEKLFIEKANIIFEGENRDQT
ncbi:pectinesterase family protein, partial [Rhizobium leguminosarum]|uniref:pectinesterase family protein n=1 Tax=Rhizobium leguminosarum TaxID=384 RepID=UPI003F9C40B9